MAVVFCYVHSMHTDPLPSSNQHHTNTVIRMGETGSASGGGEVNVSDAYVDGFWYLDELGRLATAKHSIVIREELSGADYGLIDFTTITPNPDYWTALLWKMLMGRDVLAAQVSSSSGNLRVYSHCAPNKNGISLVLLNFGDNDTQVDVTIEDGAKLMVPRYDYTLTASELTSHTIRLNGKVLSCARDGTIPPIKPMVINNASQPIIVPALSYMFVNYPKIVGSACVH